MDFTFNVPAREWEVLADWCGRYATSKAWDVARSFTRERFQIVSVNCERRE
jgi:hypothetical protein